MKEREKMTGVTVVQATPKHFLASQKKSRFTGETVTVPVVTDRESVIEKELENGLRVMKGKVNVRIFGRKRHWMHYGMCFESSS